MHLVTEEWLGPSPSVPHVRTACSDWWRDHTKGGSPRYLPRHCQWSRHPKQGVYEGVWVEEDGQRWTDAKRSL